MEVPSASVFRAVLSGDFKALLNVKQSDIVPFLPILVRFALCKASQPIGHNSWSNARKVAHRIISEIEAANKIAAYLDVDFKEIEADVQKVRRLKDKLTQAADRTGSKVHGALVGSLQHGLTVEFEKADNPRKFRLLISELLRIIDQLDTPFKFDTSDLFECPVIAREVSNMICVVSAEMPSLLPMTELSEALLRLHKGPLFLCRLLANSPDCFNRVVRSLLLKGEEQDEVSTAGRCRTKALRMLCSVHPPIMTSIQSLAIDNRKHPTLALFLALEGANSSTVVSVNGETDYCIHAASTFVPFLYNLIVKGSKETKLWFTQYLKRSQQKYRRRSGTALSLLRQYLIKQVSCHLQDKLTKDDKISEDDEKISMDEQDSDVESDTENITDAPLGSKMITQKELSEEKLAKSTLELVDQMEIEISDTTSMEDMDTGMISNNTDNLTTQIKMETSEGQVVELFSGRQKNNEEVLGITLLIKIYCGLKVQGLFFNTDESAAMFNLLTNTLPPFSEAGVKFVEAAFSILLACPFLISPPGRSEIVKQWFKWLLENQHLFDRECGGHSYGELLLLTAIHFHDNKRTQIEELISDTIGLEIKNVPRTGDFGEIRDLFLQVFSEKVVCSQAVSIACTQDLNANMTGFLPVNCVMQLLKAKSFSKYNIPLKEWLYNQLSKVTAPVHPILPSLVEEYVQSVVLGPNSGQNSRNMLYAAVPTMRHQPFTEQEITNVFTENSCSTAAQLLFLYYLLLYHDLYLSNLRTLVSPQGDLPHSYSPHVIHFMPVKRLLMECMKQQVHYAPLYPRLIKLLVTHLPHLCLVTDWMDQEEKENSSFHSPPLVLKISKNRLTPDLVKKVLTTIQSSPSRALIILQQLANLPLNELTAYHIQIIDVIPSLLDSTIPRRILNLYLQIWKELSIIESRRLWLSTVNGLRRKEETRRPFKNFTHEDLYQNPIAIILDSDTRVFRCPPLFEILLHILAAYLAASRVWLSEHAHTQKCISLAMKDPKTAAIQEREELRDAVIATQDSVVVQLLLEMCLPTKEDESIAKYGYHLSVLEEIKSLVCSHLHQMFIFDPNLTKLVHYQETINEPSNVVDEPLRPKFVDACTSSDGYPSELLATVVQGIPSMHICSDFIPELLAHKDKAKQQFAIQLGVHVIHQYPLAKSMGLARQIITKLTSLVDDIPKESLEVFFTPLFPCAILLCQTFPPLAQEMTNFLLHLGRVVTSSVCCQPFNVKSLGMLTDFSRDDITRYINVAWQGKTKVKKSTDHGAPGMIKKIEDTFLKLVDTAVLKL